MFNFQGSNLQDINAFFVMFEGRRRLTTPTLLCQTGKCCGKNMATKLSRRTGGGGEISYSLCLKRHQKEAISEKARTKKEIIVPFLL